MRQVRLSHFLSSSLELVHQIRIERMQAAEDFNFDRIRALTGSDQAALNRFTELFILHTLERDWVALKSSAIKSEGQHVKDMAHKMKASLDLYNMRRASVLIRDIEQKAFQPYESYREELNELDHLLNRIGAQMKSLLQG
jgi:hypothetical protein